MGIRERVNAKNNLRMTTRFNNFTNNIKNYASDKKLVYTFILGVIIEALCISVTCLRDISKNVPLFTALYTASFIAYFFTNLNIFGKGLIQDIRFQNPSNKSCKEETETCTNSRIIFWIIISFSIIFRFTLLPVIPSDDIYRYIWEGKLQLNMINPYTYAPDAVELEHFRDNLYPEINHKHLTTIYPPLALISFAIADFLSHSVMAMKLIFITFDLLIVLVLTKFIRKVRQNPLSILIYAWSPLVLISFAARGHCDSLQIFFATLAIYLYYCRKNRLSVAVMGMAIVSKFISVIIVPFFILRNRYKYISIPALVIIAFYLPYISAGTGLFSTLLHFGADYHFNDSGHFIIKCLTSGSATLTKIVTVLVFGGTLLYLYKKFYTNRDSDASKDDDTLRYSFIAIGTFLILAPTVHPWYLTWIVPFLCFYHSKAWLILTGTVVFYYFMNHKLFSTIIEYNGEWVWQEVHWLKLPEYLPFLVLLVYDYLKNRKRKRDLFSETSMTK